MRPDETDAKSLRALEAKMPRVHSSHRWPLNSTPGIKSLKFILLIRTLTHLLGLAKRLACASFSRLHGNEPKTSLTYIISLSF